MLACVMSYLIGEGGLLFDYSTECVYVFSCRTDCYALYKLKDQQAMIDV